MEGVTMASTTVKAPLPRLIGLQEMSAVFGFSKQAPHQWRLRGQLPAPDTVVSGVPIWRYDTIEEWAAETGRKIKNPL